MTQDKTPETIYAMINELHSAYLAQSRQTNNLLVNVQRTMLDVQTVVAGLASGLQERHAQRYQEEINGLEKEMEVLKQKLAEKQDAQQKTASKTSQDIEKIALKTYTEQQTQQLADKQKASENQKLKWKDVAVGAAIIYLVTQSLPKLIDFLSVFFSK